MSARPYQDYLAVFVSELVGRGCFQADWIGQALRQVPRHLFIEQYYDVSGTGEAVRIDPAHPTDAQLQVIYSDRGLMLRGTPHSAASQPSLVVSMLEALGVEAGQRVLEIGTGSGWNAALLMCGVGTGGHVCSIDNQPDLVEAAGRHIMAAGLPEADLLAADGGLGWTERAPFDRVIVTVGSPDIAPAWCEQLVDGGIIVVPLKTGGIGDPLLRLRKHDNYLSGGFVGWAGFMTIQGVLCSEVHDPLWPPWDRATEELLGQQPWKVTVPESLGIDCLFFSYLNGVGFRRMYGLEERFGSAFVLRDRDRHAVYVAHRQEPVAEVYGEGQGLERLLALQQKWLARGRPRITDYRVALAKDSVPLADDQQWADRRRHAFLLFSLGRETDRTAGQGNERPASG